LKQKTSINETESALINEVAVISVGDENSSFAGLSATLTEIRKLEGVLGYILRSNSSAIIDLNEQDKIIEYAILSSQVYDSSLEMATQFSLGGAESVLVEGKAIKMLCLTVGENKISIFLEKNATHAWIAKRIPMQQPNLP
jgi:predicted regulator of Ras-like GTPase activity (Roadblock/LC7/MglB family)